MRPIGILFLTLVFGGLGPVLGAEDLPEDPVSDKFKEKYQPLMDKVEQAFQAEDYAAALPQVLKIREGIEKDLGPTHSVALQVGVGVATVYAKLKKNKEAEKVLADLTARLTKAKLAESQKALFVWACTRDLAQELGNRVLARDAGAKFQALADKHPEWTAGNNGPDDQRKKEEARKADDQARQKYDGRFQEIYQIAGEDPDRAVELARKLTDDAARELGPDSPVALQAGRQLGWALANVGRHDEADRQLAQVQGRLEKQDGPATMELLFVLEERAQAVERGGGDPQPFRTKLADLTGRDRNLADQWNQELAKRAEKQAGQPPEDRQDRPPRPADLARQMDKIDQIWKEGNQKEALDMIRKLGDQARQGLPPDDPLVGRIADRTAQMERDFVPPDTTGGLGPRIKEGVDLLAQADQAAASPDPGTRAGATKLYQRAVALLDLDPEPRRDVAEALTRWARVVADQGDADRAEVLRLKAAEVQGRLGSAKAPGPKN